MTDPRQPHAHFDELAAGYALHSLDPDDELDFLGHAGQCARCQQSLAEYAEVAAALAEIAPAAEPGQQLGDRIMAAALGGGTRGSGTLGSGDVPASQRADAGHGDRPAGQPPAEVIGLRERRRPPRRLQLAAAAAAVLIAGGGIWAGLSGGAAAPQPPTAGCVQARQCYQVELTDATAPGAVARVIVTGGSVWLMPSGLAPDDAARQIYVLWQITGARVPLAVGSFDVRRDAGGPILIGRLAAPYHGTLAFAVSLQRGRAIPATPSGVVALGQVSA